MRHYDESLMTVVRQMPMWSNNSCCRTTMFGIAGE